MAANQQNRVKAKVKPDAHTHLYQRQQKMKQGSDYISLEDITLGMVLRKLRYLLVHKVWVLIKYQFHRLTFGMFEQVRFPWFKLGFLALAIFVLTQKNLHFTIDMQAPLAGMLKGGETAQSGTNEEMNLAQAVNLREEKKSVYPPIAVEDLNTRKVQAYIDRFAKVAQVEQQKFGIPASIKMAQGILESHASQLAETRATNNHFGLPMAGHAYNSAWENWRLHSEWLTRADSPFAELKNHGMNIEKWANGLQELNYSQDPAYAEKLLKIIRLYQLEQLQ